MMVLELQGCEARCIDLRITPESVLKGLGHMKKLKCLLVNNINSYNRNSKNKSYDHVKINVARLHFPYSLYQNWFKYPHFPNSLRYLYWYGYPLRCLPKAFEANNLVSLEMPSSKMKKLWKGGKVIWLIGCYLMVLLL